MGLDDVRARPEEVALATKCMIVNCGLALFARGWLPLNLVLRPVFAVLIWYGVSWARKWLLAGIGCRAAFAIWGLLYATAEDRIFHAVAPYFTTLSGVSLLIDFYAAYLLIQPESAEWFRR